MGFMLSLAVRYLTDYRDELGITTLTAPFVVSVWIIMGIQKLVSVRIEKRVDSGITINNRIRKLDNEVLSPFFVISFLAQRL